MSRIHLPKPVKRFLDGLNAPGLIEIIIAQILRTSKTVHYHSVKLFVTGPYRGPLVSQIFDHIYAMDCGKQSQEEFIEGVREDVRLALDRGEFDQWLADPGGTMNLTKSRWYDRGKRWTLKMFHFEEDEVDLPHQHNDFMSFQIVYSGKIHLKEYDRLERVDDETIRLKKVTDTILEPGDSFLTMETYRNVHWFKPVDGPVTSVNFNIRGHTQDRFDDSFKKKGRHYLIPLEEAEEGCVLLAREASKERAKEEIIGKTN